MDRRRELIVLDTHVWLWWTSTRSSLSEEAFSAIETAESVGVATISCWEVAMLVRSERIGIDRDLDTWIAQALGQDRVVALPLDAETAVDAALLDDPFPGDPADRMIYATARRHGAILVTKDRRLRDYDGAGTLW